MHIINQSHCHTHLVALVLILTLFFGFSLRAQEKLDNNQKVTVEERLTLCYKKEIQLANENTRVLEIESKCKNAIAQQEEIDTTQKSPLEQRIENEKRASQNPNVITPHKPNYLLPFSYVSQPNDEPYKTLNPGDGGGLLDNYEAKFQISFKAPILQSILRKDDALFFGFTLQSYWQMYNSDISSPFRETNYQPEIFYALLNDFNVGGWKNRVVLVGVEHQSNGRTQPLSRSWNRVYANFIWENNRWITSFKPWYRIPEKSKQDPSQADGDDNPDIEKYMGNFELSGVYKFDNQTLGITVRNNLRSNNKGALQLDWTFSLGKRFRGYAQYFNGYGESLIDYDQHVQRFGLGISLTDIF